MCLGIPGRVVETYHEHDVLMGKVEFGGVFKRVCLEHVPDVRVDDYVLVHVGFALSRIDGDEAQRVFEFLDTMNQLDELGPRDDRERGPVAGRASPVGDRPPGPGSFVSPS
jgi:hydrogenase expression/formation protein HypC